MLQDQSLSRSTPQINTFRTLVVVWSIHIFSSKLFGSFDPKFLNLISKPLGSSTQTINKHINCPHLSLLLNTQVNSIPLYSTLQLHPFFDNRQIHSIGQKLTITFNLKLNRTCSPFFQLDLKILSRNNS